MGDPLPVPRPRALNSSGLESTASLLARARHGDARARDQLLRRYLPAFRRWATGRLPRIARDLVDTDDIVQQTLLRALRRMDEFEPEREGAFLAYLRQILVNQIRDEMRRCARRPGYTELSEEFPSGQPSALDQLIWEETLHIYEAALKQLPEMQREAFMMRIELGFTHEQVAEALGSPSPNAARLLVVRALVRMAEQMRERRLTSGDAL